VNVNRVKCRQIHTASWCRRHASKAAIQVLLIDTTPTLNLVARNPSCQERDRPYAHAGLIRPRVLLSSVTATRRSRVCDSSATRACSFGPEYTAYPSVHLRYKSGV